MKFKLPLVLPLGLKPIITQPYGATGNLDFYKQAGINIPFHNGVDITTNGTDRQSYGCAIITPSDGWTIFRVYSDGNPMAANGNEVVMTSPVFNENGVNKYIELRCVHLSEAEPLEGKIVKDNTIVGYTGNSGLVYPQPTTIFPYAGTHLHLGMIEYQEVGGVMTNLNIKNGVYGLIDPLTRIDINDFDTAPEDVTKDAPPLAWAINLLGLTSIIDKVKYVWKILFNK